MTARDPMKNNYSQPLFQHQEVENSRKELTQSKAVETAMILVFSFVRIRERRAFKRGEP
jgi:AmiR/NasT family two-component response regulator